MGTDVVSPDVKRLWNRDIYSFVSVKPQFEEELEWSEKVMEEVQNGQRFFVNDYVAIFNGLERVDHLEFAELREGDVAVRANITVLAEEGEKYLVRPLYIIKDGREGKQPEVVKEIATRIGIESINPDAQTVTLGVNTTQKDFIIIKALEKPHINVLWIGTLVMAMGFLIAIRRRYIEFQVMRDKGIE